MVKDIIMWVCLFTISACVILGSSIELTFELPDKEVQCFFEDIKQNVKSVLEFQVVTGGKYDVDVSIEDPQGNVLYKEVKKQYASHQWTTSVEGPYKVCFSNEFSTFSHKVVYMDWQVGDPDFLKQATPGLAAMTQLQASAAKIGDNLRAADDYQTHHKLREATGRKRAEDLNERVLFWSLGQSAVIILIGVAQVSFYNLSEYLISR
uniref:GOLD domain-containing protein n=1 Tax=Syphacia muris TaxID=451379 RepID=A0A0N5B091_9BILA